MEKLQFKVGDIIFYEPQGLTAEIYEIEKAEYGGLYYICKDWSDGVDSAGAFENEIRHLTPLDKLL